MVALLIFVEFNVRILVEKLSLMDGWRLKFVSLLRLQAILGETAMSGSIGLTNGYSEKRRGYVRFGCVLTISKQAG